MGKINWERSSARNSQQLNGRVGEVTFFVIKPWTRNDQSGVELTVLIPGHGGAGLRPLPHEEAAKGWCEEILKEFLRTAGLQFKPAPRKAKTA